MPEPRVLVVEDDQQLQDVIAEALRDDGYHVEVAADGEAALELARRNRPDVVILDLMMPRMNGEQFSVAVRQVAGLASVPIIVLSASRTSLETAARIGAAEAVRKPFDLFDLSARVSRLLA